MGSLRPGFLRVLRVGELTAQDSSPPSAAADAHTIGIHDISRPPSDPPQYLRVHLRVSKTDPFGKGVYNYLGATGSTICPVAAILSFLMVRPTHLLGPLLRFPDGSILTRTVLVASVRKALAASGIDSSRYSGHSFRIGAVTTAALVGLPDHTITMLGRWESSAYQLYVRTPAEEMASVSSRLVSSVPARASDPSLAIVPPTAVA